MKYWRIKLCKDDGVTGTFPQIQEYEEGSELQSIDIQKSLKESLVLDVLKIKILDGFHLAKNAVLTDLIDDVHMYLNEGMLMNNKLYNLLSEFGLPNNEKYPSVIYSKGSKIFDYSYYIFKNHKNLPLVINDFTLRFKVLSQGRLLTEEKNFKSILDYEKFRESLSGKGVMVISVLPVKVKYNSQDNILLTTYSFDNNLYVNDTVKDCVLENEITGLTFVQADHIIG